MAERPQTSPSESFLARRARLKAERQRAAATPTVAAPVAPAAPAVTPAPSPAQTDADMPPLETLTGESDFGQFLAEGVSDALRQAALRKLFHLPEFNVVDGLNDYDGDYTQFEQLGEVVTRFQQRMRAREETEQAAADAARAGDAESARQARATGQTNGDVGPLPPAAVDGSEPPATEAVADDPAAADDGALES